MIISLSFKLHQGPRRGAHCHSRAAQQTRKGAQMHKWQQELPGDKLRGELLLLQQHINQQQHSLPAENVRFKQLPTKANTMLTTGSIINGLGWVEGVLKQGKASHKPCC